MSAGPAPRTASVVVCAFDEQRWGDLLAVTDSLAHQSRAADELIVVIDHNEQLLRKATAELRCASVAANSNERGLSGARNTGVQLARGDVVAFIDDDAIPSPDWLELLLSHYHDPRVIAVGGAVIPRWVGGRPRGFPAEFDWVVGCSYLGLPVARAAVRNLIGANMSFRRSALAGMAGFSDGIGRVGRKPMGCEETELCIRLHAAHPDAVILYEPAARVHHRVPGSRASLRYFCSRCFSEGVSKALVARAAGSRRALSAERSYVRHVLTAAVLRGARSTLTGSWADGIQAAGVTLGLGMTTVGFLVGSARRAVEATSGKRRLRRPRADEDWLMLDVHDRVGIRVHNAAPAAPQLAEMFAPFRTSRLDHCELTIEPAGEPLKGTVSAGGEHRYRDDAVELPGRLQVVVDGDGFRLGGSGELLAPTLALLDALLVPRHAAMIHAASVARHGLGVCLAAAGGAGKTSATIGLVRGHGFAFMGDDWTFVAEDGQILGFAKPLFVRPHHRSLFPELFAETRKPLAPAALARPLGRLATAAHPAITQHAKLARTARRWWPEHMIVPPEVALPGVPVARSASLAAAVFIERTAGSGLTVEPRDCRWMTSRLIGDFAAELPRGARDLQALLGATGLIAVDSLIASKARILGRALERTPCYLLRAPEEMRAGQAARAIAEQVERLLEPHAEARVAVA